MVDHNSITIHALSRRQITYYMEIHPAINDERSINTSTDAIYVKASCHCQSIILEPSLSRHFDQHRKGS